VSPDRVGNGGGRQRVCAATDCGIAKAVSEDAVLAESDDIVMLAGNSYFPENPRVL